MNRMKTIIRLTKSHSENCLLLKNKAFYWCFKRTLFCNYAGNDKAKVGRDHFFLEFQCNDPNCQARVIVRNSHISKKIEDFILWSKTAIVIGENP